MMLILNTLSTHLVLIDFGVFKLFYNPLLPLTIFFCGHLNLQPFPYSCFVATCIAKTR